MDMKKCKCTCGHEIDLRLRSNIELELIDRGYEYTFNEYYTVCPYCGDRKKIAFDRLPLRMKWRLMKEFWFKQ